MSVLIKGMEMPENCFDCPCVEAEFCECAAREHLSLPKDEYGAADGHIPEWCPMIEIPPHGRLIDADALLKTMIAERNRIVETYGENDEYARCLDKYAISMVVSAPTIIPAEEVDDEN